MINRKIRSSSLFSFVFSNNQLIENEAHVVYLLLSLPFCVQLYDAVRKGPYLAKRLEAQPTVVTDDRF